MFQIQSHDWFTVTEHDLRIEVMLTPIYKLEYVFLINH